MLIRFGQAVLVAIVVGIACLFLGTILVDALGKVPIAHTIGGLLLAWGWILGILAGLWWFFFGQGAIFPQKGP